jgi:hypothetical protein
MVFSLIGVPLLLSAPSPARDRFGTHTCAC